MERTTVVYLALLMLAASTNSIISPSSSTSSSINTSSSSSSVIGLSSSSSSSISQSSPTSSSTFKPSGASSGSTIKPSITTSSEFGFLSPKPSSSYEVTENVIDIPDDRTLPPIRPDFSISKPLNVANASVSVNKVSKNDTGDENNQLKRTSFTYVHFTKDTDKTKEGGVKKLFKGIKYYVYNLKRGVVDGLHNYFHRDDKKKDKEESFYDKFHKSNEYFNNNDDVDFHHKFHRSYHSDENLDDYEYDHDDFEHEVTDLND